MWCRWITKQHKVAVKQNADENPKQREDLSTNLNLQIDSSIESDNSTIERVNFKIYKPSPIYFRNFEQLGDTFFEELVDFSDMGFPD